MSKHFEILFKEWIQVYGRPVEVYSDNDVQFTSEKGYWRGLLSRMAVRVHFSIPYKPSSNGLCERLNESFINIMRVLRRQKKGQGLAKTTALRQLDFEFKTVHEDWLLTP